MAKAKNIAPVKPAPKTPITKKPTTPAPMPPVKKASDCGKGSSPSKGPKKGMPPGKGGK